MGRKKTGDQLCFAFWVFMPTIETEFLIRVPEGERRSGLAWTLGFCVMIGGSVKD